MKGRYLEATYRKGKLLAAYLYLPRREGDRSARVLEFPGGVLVDVTGDGRPIGVELISPTAVTLDQMNTALESFGLERMAEEELSALYPGA